jgi:hypothetical protein
MPESKSRLVRVVEGASVPRAELACGRVGDDDDVMAAQLVRPALRLLTGRAACMAASCCTCMTWRFVSPHACDARTVRLDPHTSRDWTCRARRRLVVGVPLMGNGSEMQPTGQRLDVLPVWVLTRVFSPPCPESLP